ncbi:MAG: UDP-N-acetylmuramoyl-L-alanine--D-glutamate ligase [Flavobacteriaceae bacterium]|nr:UDP-N-acetylmuramoyl-L-alanine--D-glutamate ligase [Flavobacteriaceae bacterium]
MKIVVLGVGESGLGAALLAKSKNMDVFVSDLGNISEENISVLKDNNIEFEQLKHDEQRVLSADIIVKSPGIPDNVSIVKKAVAKGIAVISEIEFAYKYNKGVISAVTGSNGKTTTVMILNHILDFSKKDVALVGNIGDSYARQIFKQEKDNYVIEMSSFQLDGIVDFAPHIAVMTNITPDHLDRYDYDFDKYIASKFRITENQTNKDYFIYDIDDEVIVDYLSKNNINAKKLPFSVKRKLEEGAYLENNKIMIKIAEEKFEVDLDSTTIKGKHNVKNTMAASLASRILNIRKESIRESLKVFEGADHRLENLGYINDINYINDSKATNVNSVYYALETVNRPIIWIVGGKDKGNDYSDLYDLVREKVKAVICLGADNTKLINTFGAMVDDIVDTKSMSEAMMLAKSFAEKGDTILLSPACASFDLFESYEDRGDQFKREINNN